MTNQPNEAAIYALSLLHLGTIDWLPVPGTHRLNGHAARVVLAAIRDGKVPGIVEAKSLPLIRDEMTAMQAELASLRSVLAAAEKDRAASARDWEAALSAHDRRVEELNAALAKLAEAERDCAGYKERIHELSDELGACEKERDEARAKLAEAEKALLVIGERAVCDFDDATVGDVDRVVTDHMKYKDWLRSVMTAATERDALAAQLAEARGLLGEALPWVIRLLNHADPDCPICGGHATPESSGHRKSCTVRRMSAFLAPPSDRGAEERS